MVRELTGTARARNVRRGIRAKVKRALPVLMGSLALLGGCDKVEFDDDKLMTDAKAAIAKELADPASAKFKSARIDQRAENRINGIVCGEILGKFDSGKQGDYRQFIYVKSVGFAGIAPSPKDGEGVPPETTAYQNDFDDMWQTSCPAQ
jgi:hypothetical protein